MVESYNRDMLFDQLVYWFNRENETVRNVSALTDGK